MLEVLCTYLHEHLSSMYLQDSHRVCKKSLHHNADDNISAGMQLASFLLLSM